VTIELDSKTKKVTFGFLVAFCFVTFW